MDPRLVMTHRPTPRGGLGKYSNAAPDYNFLFDDSLQKVPLALPREKPVYQRDASELQGNLVI